MFYSYKNIICVPKMNYFSQNGKAGMLFDFMVTAPLYQ